MPQGDMVPSETWGQVQLTRPAKTPRTGGRGPRACPGAGGDSSCLPAKPGCFITIVQSFPPSIWSTSFSGWNSLLQIFTGKRATPSSSQYCSLWPRSSQLTSYRKAVKTTLYHTLFWPLSTTTTQFTLFITALSLSF